MTLASVTLVSLGLMLGATRPGGGQALLRQTSQDTSQKIPTVCFSRFINLVNTDSDIYGPSSWSDETETTIYDGQDDQYNIVMKSECFKPDMYICAKKKYSVN
jgi:hypothetical protein